MSKENAKEPGKPRRKGTSEKNAKAARENGLLGGRPEIVIQWDQFDKLCERFATLEDIAGWFECSTDTIERRVQDEKGMGFADYFLQKSARGRISLRGWQMQRAQGNPTLGIQPSDRLLIHLGVNHLGQTTHKQESKISGSLAITGGTGDPFAEFIDLIVELANNKNTLNELNNILKPFGIQLLTDGATRQIHQGKE